MKLDSRRRHDNNKTPPLTLLRLFGNDNQICVAVSEDFIHTEPKDPKVLIISSPKHEVRGVENKKKRGEKKKITTITLENSPLFQLRHLLL